MGDEPLTLRMIELFAGIGSQTQALKNLGIDHEIVAISEIDRHAIKSYEAIHGQVNNLGDISKIDKLPDADIWTYSFPCQDISVAGRGAGFCKTSGTRSGLLWEVERLLNVSPLPNYLLMENVPAIINKKHKAHFLEWVRALETLGYTSEWATLNASDFDVPQSRKRTFMVSIQGDKKFMFPTGTPTNKTIRDILEAEVDEKYYIHPSKWGDMMDSLKEKKISRTIKTGGHNSPTDKHNWDWVAVPKLIHVGDIHLGNNDRMNRVYSPEGLCPTISAQSGGNTEVKIIDDLYKQRPIREYDTSSPALRCNCGELKVAECRAVLTPDRVEKRQNGRRFKNDGEPMFTLTAQDRHGVAVCTQEPHEWFVRKLTPLECWRLMGFPDSAYHAAEQAGVSKTQLYRQAGNSIVVPVLEAIFREMLNPSKAKQMTWREYA